MSTLNASAVCAILAILGQTNASPAGAVTAQVTPVVAGRGATPNPPETTASTTIVPAALVPVAHSSQWLVRNHYRPWYPVAAPATPTVAATPYLYTATYPTYPTTYRYPTTYTYPITYTYPTTYPNVVGYPTYEYPQAVIYVK